MLSKGRSSATAPTGSWEQDRFVFSLDCSCFDQVEVLVILQLHVIFRH